MKIKLFQIKKMGYKKKITSFNWLANRTFGYKPLVNFNRALNIILIGSKKIKIIDLATDFPYGMSSAIR